VPYLQAVAQLFHVTSSNNRDSITRHGLDWIQMKAARGIARSTAPEQEGIFVCFSEPEADFSSE
jgi:hypothetical protein